MRTIFTSFGFLGLVLLGAVIAQDRNARPAAPSASSTPGVGRTWAAEPLEIAAIRGYDAERREFERALSERQEAELLGPFRARHHLAPGTAIGFDRNRGLFLELLPTPAEAPAPTTTATTTGAGAPPR